MHWNAIHCVMCYIITVEPLAPDLDACRVLIHEEISRIKQQHHNRHNATAVADAISDRSTAAPLLKRHASASNINDRASKRHIDVQPTAVITVTDSTIVDSTMTSVTEDIVQSVLFGDDNQLTIERNADVLDIDIDGARYWQDEMMIITSSNCSDYNAFAKQVKCYIKHSKYTQ
jgi:hypothetical protein